MTSRDFDDLIHRVQKIRDRAASDKAQLIAANPNWNPDRDARVTALSKLINVINSLQLGFTFISRHLLNATWWLVTAKEQIPQSDKIIYATEFQNFVKVGFVQALYSSVCESSFRIFLRTIDPAACNGGTGDFKTIYECLLHSKLATAPAGATALLDLLRLVRNTIHNNGVYITRSGRDAAVTYRGTTYEFRHGEPVEGIDWYLLLQMTDDLRDVLSGVIADQAISGVSSQITDPFASP